MMTKKEAFKFLELSEQATLDEIRKKYKKLVLKYHPDKGGATQDFQKLQTACEIAIKTVNKVTLDEDNKHEMSSDWASNLMKSWFNHMKEEEQRRDLREKKIREEKDAKGYATLSHEQEQVLKQLVNELESYLQQEHKHPLGDKYIYKNETKEIFTWWLEGRFNDMNYYEYSTNIPELNELIYPLADHINQYIIDCDLQRFKEKCNATFEAVDYDKSKPFLVEMYDAIIFLFRSFFRLFDNMITYISQSKQLMADTSTPLAQIFFNRPHFFEYSTRKAKKASKQRQKLTDEFHAAIERLEKLLPWPQRKKGKNFSVVMDHLDGEARIIFLNAMRKHLPTGYESQKEDFWKHLTDEQYTEVCIEMKDYWPKIIKTAKEFKFILQFINEDQRTAIYNARKEGWHELIHASEDFQIFEFLNEEQRTALYHVKQTAWSELIEAGHDFAWVLRYLNEEQRTAIFNVKKGAWADVIKTGDDLGSVLAYLNEEQRTIIYNIKREAWAEIIKNGVEFFHVMQGLSPEQGRAIYHVIQKDWFKIIKKGVDYHFAFDGLKNAGLDTDVLLNAMKGSGNKFIKYHGDIIEALYKLDDTECNKFFTVMGDELSQFIATKEDVDTILGGIYYGDAHKETIHRLLQKHFPQAFRQAPGPC